VFARFCVVLSFASLLFPAPSTLPNGIRLIDLPAQADRFVLVVGYTSGVRNENRGMSGLAAVVSRYLASSDAARSMALSAFASGGTIEYIDELDRTGMRISVPNWAKPMVVDHVAKYLSDPGEQNLQRLGLARSAASGAASSGTDFLPRIEDEIRLALLGSHPYHHPLQGWKADVDRATVDDIARFIRENYGTDRAFIAMTSAIPEQSLKSIAAVSSRTSVKLAESPFRMGKAERTLRFPSNEAEGSVIFASPVPGVFYRSWYTTLMFDRLVRRLVPGKPTTTLLATVDPYYWRLAIPVPSGQFGDQAEEVLLQEINRMQFARAKPEDLEAARREAKDYLDSGPVREWFASHDIESRREEGIQWVASFTADDMRATARDLIVSNRVVASWSTKPRQVTVQVESLSGSGGASGQLLSPDPLSVLPGPVPVSPFPSHTHETKVHSTPERLSSGIWLASSNRTAVFVSGQGMLNLPDEPSTNDLREFQKYRPERILVLVPADKVDRARTLWGSFKGNNSDSTVVTPQGSVPNIDLPALVILKAALDRKLIESGRWSEATVAIDASRGAALQIEGSPQVRAQVVQWIKELATAPMPEADYQWVREVAIHHLNDVLPDIQALLWQRVPDYILPDLETIAATQVQDVAKLYF